MNRIFISGAALRAVAALLLLTATTAIGVTGATCAPPPAAMVSWYPGENNANDIKGGNNGTLVNGATFAAGETGQGFSTDGIGSYVQIADSASLHPASLTVDAWINLRSIDSGFRSFVSKGLGPGVYDSFVLWMNNGSFNTSVSVADGNGITINSNITLSSNTWYHVAVTVDDATHLATLYLNGSAVGTGTLGGSLGYDATPVLIGADTSNGGPAEFTNGVIDEVHIMDRALSAAEIQGIYQAGTAGLCQTQACATTPPGMIAWYKGESIAGNVAADAQGGNPGTLNGGVSLVTGEVGQAYNLDGASQSIAVPDSPALHPQTVSVDAWVQFASLDSTVSGAAAGTQYIVFKQNTRFDHFEGYDLQKFRGKGGDYFAFAVSTAAGVQDVAVSSVPILTGTWYHVAGTFDGASLALYVNGQLAQRTAHAAALDVGNAPLFLGTSGMPDFDGKFDGALDEVQVFKRALTAQEVATLYNAGNNGQCAGCAALQGPPAAWYKGEGDARDSSGYGNHGSLQGDATFAPGIAGQGFSFDGNGDAVLLNNAAAFQTQTFTIDAWVRRGSTSTISSSAGGGAVFAYGPGGYGFYLHDGGTQGALCLGQIGATEFCSSALFVTDTAFHHVAVTTAAGQVYFYLDGVQDGPFSYNPGYTFGTPPAVGARGDNFANSILGQLDEVQFFPRALGAPEIYGIYCAGSRGSCGSGAPTGSIAFTAVKSADLNTLYTSNSVTISGLGGPAAIIFKGAGGYSINNGAYTTAAGTVSNGDTVKVQLTSSPSTRTTVHNGVVIGGAGSAFVITTRTADTTPHPFSFASTINAVPGSLATSATTVTIAGLESGYNATPVSVINGAYSINGAGFTTAPGTIKNTDTLQLQTTAAQSLGTTVHAVVRVGDFSASYSVSTRKN